MVDVLALGDNLVKGARHNTSVTYNLNDTYIQD